MEIVPFEIAKKLKEKGFTCKYPIAMYNEIGEFHALYTSAPHNENIKSIFGNREYYDYDDFDDRDFIAPTISQVLKWLRKSHNLHISIKPYPCEDGLMWLYEVRRFSSVLVCVVVNKTGFQEPEEAALAGIEYVLDNLI